MMCVNFRDLNRNLFQPLRILLDLLPHILRQSPYRPAAQQNTYQPLSTHYHQKKLTLNTLQTQSLQTPTPLNHLHHTLPSQFGPLRPHTQPLQPSLRSKRRNTLTKLLIEEKSVYMEFREGWGGGEVREVLEVVRQVFGLARRIYTTCARFSEIPFLINGSWVTYPDLTKVI